MRPEETLNPPPPGSEGAKDVLAPCRASVPMDDPDPVARLAGGEQLRRFIIAIAPAQAIAAAGLRAKAEPKGLAITETYQPTGLRLGDAGRVSKVLAFRGLERLVNTSVTDAVTNVTRR